MYSGTSDVVFSRTFKGVLNGGSRKGETANTLFWMGFTGNSKFESSKYKP